MGSCLCGGVRYEAEGPLTLVVRCHCRQCRKASGAEFATNGSVTRTGFRIRSGEDLLARFESSPGVVRVFCRCCGSPIYKEDAKVPDRVRLRLGCLDTELESGPNAHIYVSDKPRWSEIRDGLPEHPGALGG